MKDYILIAIDKKRRQTTPSYLSFYIECEKEDYDYFYDIRNCIIKRPIDDLQDFTFIDK